MIQISYFTNQALKEPKSVGTLAKARFELRYWCVRGTLHPPLNHNCRWLQKARLTKCAVEMVRSAPRGWNLNSEFRCLNTWQLQACWHKWVQHEQMEHVGETKGTDASSSRYPQLASIKDMGDSRYLHYPQQNRETTSKPTQHLNLCPQERQGNVQT